MKSTLTLLPGQSVTVAAGAVITLDSVERFNGLGAASLDVTGIGAVATRNQPPASDAHAVNVVEGDPE
jgi:hypothetical protein